MERLHYDQGDASQRRCLTISGTRRPTDTERDFAMPQLENLRENAGEKQQGVFGEGVPVNGIDNLAARRAHMRELTAARQAAERRRSQPWSVDSGAYANRLEATRARSAEMYAELARIEDEHQRWLDEHDEKLR